MIMPLVLIGVMAPTSKKTERKDLTNSSARYIIIDFRTGVFWDDQTVSYSLSASIWEI